MPESAQTDPVRPRWPVFALVSLVVGLAILAWLLASLAVTLACNVENSSCSPNPDERVRYSGRLFSYEGRPAANQLVEFSSDVYGDDLDLEIETDENGRFCVGAAPGYSTFGVVGQRRYDMLVVDSDAPVDPRLRDSRLLARIKRESLPENLDPEADRAPFFLTSPPVAFTNGGTDLPTELWDPATDEGAECLAVTERIPILKRQDAESSWQYLLLTALALAAAGFLLIALRRTRGRPVADGVAEPALSARAALGLATGLALAGLCLFALILFSLV